MANNEKEAKVGNVHEWRDFSSLSLTGNSSEQSDFAKLSTSYKRMNRQFSQEDVGASVVSSAEDRVEKAGHDFFNFHSWKI